MAVSAFPTASQADASQKSRPLDPGLRKRLIAGLLTVFLLVVGVGGWTATANLSSAVIAPGLVVVEGNVKKIQHPTGGVVGEIKVKNGNRVRAGDLLLRLDDTQTGAALGIIVSQLVELTGRKARLAAEREELPSIEFPTDFAAFGPEAHRVAEGERRLFEARVKTAAGQKGQLKERIGQLRLEIEGLSSQKGAKARELKLVRDELARVSDMYKRGLLPMTRMLAMQRDEARIDGEHGELSARIARAGGQINEIDLQILTIDQTMRSEAQKELREVEARIAELAERRISAKDQLQRVELRAPLSGIVHDLSAHTVGGVVIAGETVMLIVPDEDALSVEVHIAPADVDQVSLGQASTLRFSAFNQQTTPEVPGTVTRIAADLTAEPQTGRSYFVARIKADEQAVARLKGLKLVPGMPVEAFIQTGDRTALSYLVKPFTDQFARVFREE